MRNKVTRSDRATRRQSHVLFDQPDKACPLGLDTGVRPGDQPSIQKEKISCTQFLPSCSALMLRPPNV
jgi:hypothetical protein